MSMIKIDMNSEEFQNELAKTLKFTDKVIKQFGWEYNPQAEVNEGVQMGLARNKMLYNKRFCPCFMVEEVDGKARSIDDRICPCKPAIEREMVEIGACHCGIFCTPEYAAAKRKELNIETAVHTHSRGLSTDECQELLKKNDLDGDELAALMEAKELGMVTFKLIDVREHMEWQMGHIKGADLLIPTSGFFNLLDEAALAKDEPVILYCHVGSRSLHCQRIMNDMGYRRVGNLTHGIVSYHGDIVK
ncbi:MAG: sulfurtransferase [Sulfurimonas sp.]|nr:MAG: sulfurtransferase [Sulfurimonas sp.]